MRQQIRLQNWQGSLVPGEIRPLAEIDIVNIQSIWQPMLTDLKQVDSFWDWALKKRLSLNNPEYEAYAVEVEELTQGVLWIETQRHFSQQDRNCRLVYIVAMASAPWNRRKLNPQPYLYGVGTILLQFARRRSLQLGYGGRLGLHALPGSESFYDRYNMLDGGPDPDYEDMVYFEYGAIDQQRFEAQGYEV